MKQIITLLLSFLLLQTVSFAQSDAIVGEWYTQDKKAVVTIFIDGETVSGKTTWMKEPFDEKGNPKLDKLNPDEELRGRERLGLKIMQDFTYKGNNTWEDGKWVQYYENGQLV